MNAPSTISQDPGRFQFPTAPIADPRAVIQAGPLRVTVLMDRLLRLEYSPGQIFEDRPSQAFWFRQQPVPEFTTQQANGRLIIETAALRLEYHLDTKALSRQALKIDVKSLGTTWHYGDHDRLNLRGTTRTLDEVDGATRLEAGLNSRAGFAVADDSKNLVFNADGWLEPRGRGEILDLYFFGYGHDYAGCLKDYCKVTGHTPLVPRWVLGNWWSRYWAYRQEELRGLMQDFRSHELPLSVCIIDMDWHITATGNSSSGWTGYTWNRSLFPDPAEFIQWLHDQGLRTALNLHPADGIHPHEGQYPEIAEYMGVDPAAQVPVAFDIADPHFTRGYFDILHHPYEKMGVDFWWLDWQQGVFSKLPGLDPLWWLNHLHFQDSGRDLAKRPFIFSRWGGLGNHRYPLGFSGDSIVTWASLAFQPYFTATAANVNFGWWSHDIGGHMFGAEDGELFARWVQFGIFSPINRLHSTSNAFQDRRPWAYDAEKFNVVKACFQLRHALIPYIYSMAWRNTTQDLPLVTPMYFSHPEAGEAYECPDQYWFGSELVAAPYVTPANPETRLSRGAVWLPEGLWFNFFTGEALRGGKWHALAGRLDEIPVFATAGAIVPLGPRQAWGGIDNPGELFVHLFPGASRQFELFEDDGVSRMYREGGCAVTRFEQAWDVSALRFTIHPLEGDASAVPAQRGYTLEWHGVARPHKVDLWVDGAVQSAAWTYDETAEALRLEPVTISPHSRLEVQLTASGPSLLSNRDRRPETWQRILESFRCDPTLKAALNPQLAAFQQEPGRLARYERLLTEAQMAVLLQSL